VTCAASTCKNRGIELPGLLVCPRRRRFPEKSSNATSFQIACNLLSKGGQDKDETFLVEAWCRLSGVFGGASMRIVEMSHHECTELLNRASVGRLACCLENEPYVVPVCFAYQPEYLYVFSTLGQKIKWMRQNPKVCFQTDDIENRLDWASVIVNGTYLELREPRYAAEKAQARERLARYSDWWHTPLAERREQTDDLSIEPIFFRIDITSMSGLRGIVEAG
jgi:nitroimidazol reductase NimA-like FMN-containing flavoprotein (pyridoxamine 5'-phosphate oxidase superfamily)